MKMKKLQTSSILCFTFLALKWEEKHEENQTKSTQSVLMCEIEGADHCYDPEIQTFDRAGVKKQT